MLYDLNIPWSGTPTSIDALQRLISFLSELNYSTIALNYQIDDKKIPPQITNAIPATLPFTTPKNLTVLRRCTVIVSDPAQNARLPAVAQAYDILALRPTTEKAFLAACSNITEQSIISLDLTVRYPFHFRPKPFMTAIKRGVRFEICYGQATASGSGSTERRNFISNVISIVRATSGRGLIISSEAKSVLGIRGSADVANLLAVWGVSSERAKEAATINPRSVVVNEFMKRRGYRGVIDIVDGGEVKGGKGKESAEAGSDSNKGNKGKRKMDDNDNENMSDATPLLSKRHMKKMRLEQLKHGGVLSASPQSKTLATPVKDTTNDSTQENGGGITSEATGD